MIWQRRLDAANTTRALISGRMKAVDVGFDMSQEHVSGRCAALVVGVLLSGRGLLSEGPLVCFVASRDRRDD